MELTQSHLPIVNSLTKYPSIPTFHKLGEKGQLLPESVDFPNQALVATEKVDGTNSRIVLFPDGRYIVGSREELLHGKGDLIFNPSMGIVQTLRSTADQLSRTFKVQPDAITVFYFETYGGKTTAAAKQYTSDRSFGIRLFDVANLPVDRMSLSVKEISLWRENGGKDFLIEDQLKDVASRFELHLAPRISLQSDLPTEIEQTHQWLEQHIPKTLVALDSNAGGRAEGIVVRTSDRSKIAKIRFEDYRRHLRRAQ